MGPQVWWIVWSAEFHVELSQVSYDDFQDSHECPSSGQPRFKKELKHFVFTFHTKHSVIQDL